MLIAKSFTRNATGKNQLMIISSHLGFHHRPLNKYSTHTHTHTLPLSHVSTCSNAEDMWFFSTCKCTAESIEQFIEGQALLRSYMIRLHAHPLHPSFPVRELDRQHTATLRKGDNLPTVEVCRGDVEPNHTTSRKPGPLYENWTCLFVIECSTLSRFHNFAKTLTTVRPLRNQQHVRVIFLIFAQTDRGQRYSLYIYYRGCGREACPCSWDGEPTSWDPGPAAAVSLWLAAAAAASL